MEKILEETMIMILINFFMIFFLVMAYYFDWCHHIIYYFCYGYLSNLIVLCVFLIYYKIAQVNLK